ncbi:MAG: sel1 repeat family protein [Paludibacteraceae bacterium]|nr:sel1 repeat family protein [Paludibacteraceae bacterium]
MRKFYQFGEAMIMTKKGIVSLKLSPEPLEFEPISEIEIMEDKAMRLIKEGDIRKGRIILSDLYKKGDYWAGNTYAYGLQCGWFGKREYKKAFEIYFDCAKNGESGAMNNLGFSYSNGLGVKKDIALAIHWYERAMEAGFLDAKNNLALELLYAPGNLRDYERAYALVSDKSMANDANALNTLGRIYEEGYGVPVDLHKAYDYYKMAVKIGGCPTAKHNLERFIVKKK